MRPVLDFRASKLLAGGIIALSVGLTAPANAAGSDAIALKAGSSATIGATEGNMRDIIRQNELAVIERLFGSDAAAAAAADIDAPQIINGKKSPKGKWPGQVALLQANISSNYDAQFCGGSLIRKKWVLTAAHCVEPFTYVNEIEVLYKTNSLNKGGKRVKAAAVIYHGSYDSKTFDYDIAVIKLQKNAKPKAFYKNVSKKKAKKLTKPGRDAYVMGWGNTSTTSKVYPVDLREVMVPFVSRKKCNGSNSYNGDITNRMICAGFMQGGKDACQGDSGGPLMVKYKGKWRTQAGIVSWGIGCAKKNFPGVYTDLGDFQKWIKNQIKNN